MARPVSFETNRGWCSKDKTYIYFGACLGCENCLDFSEITKRVICGYEEAKNDRNQTAQTQT